MAPEDIPDHQPVLAPREERHFKLYAKGNDRLKYREAWFENDTSIVEHWGDCGDRGEVRRYTHQSNAAAREQYMCLKNGARDEGFRPIPLERHAKLLVEFRITGMGSQSNIGRRHALESFLDELVGWLGLGHVDGGSIGSGTMEVLCYVVDFQIAQRALDEAMRKSPFSDFSRIYREH